MRFPTHSKRYAYTKLTLNHSDSDCPASINVLFLAEKNRLRFLLTHERFHSLNLVLTNLPTDFSITWRWVSIDRPISTRLYCGGANSMMNTSERG